MKALTRQQIDVLKQLQGKKETNTPTAAYIYLDNGTDRYRFGVRSGYLVLDQVLTSTGFSGTENTDWVNVLEFKTST